MFKTRDSMMNPSYDHFRPMPQDGSAPPIVPVEQPNSHAIRPAGFASSLPMDARRPVLVTPPSGASPRGAAFQIDPISLLKAMQRRWRIAAPLGILLGVASAAFVWFLIPPSRYTASSRLFVAEIAPPVHVFDSGKRTRTITFSDRRNWFSSRARKGIELGSEAARNSKAYPNSDDTRTRTNGFGMN